MAFRYAHCRFPQYHFSRACGAVTLVYLVWLVCLVERNFQLDQINHINRTNQIDLMNESREGAELRFSQSRGSRGVDAQATRRQQPGEVRLGLLQNQVVIDFSGVNPRQ